MSFVFPWLVSIRRPNRAETVGDVGYNAIRGAADEALVTDGIGLKVADGLRASIQIDRVGRRNPVGLSSDTDSQPLWKIFIPVGAVRGMPPDLMRSGDIIVASMFKGVPVDSPARYQITAPYLNSLGWQARAKVLEV